MESGVLTFISQGNNMIILGLILLGVGVLTLVLSLNAFITARVKKSHLLLTRRNRMSVSSLAVRILLSLVFIFFSLSVFLTGSAMRLYTIFTHEERVARLECVQQDTTQKTMLIRFQSVVRGQEQAPQTYALPGDQWEVNARILKWTPQAHLLGFNTAYRLHMVKGIYQTPEDETNRPHQAYGLNPGQDWLWDLLTKYQKSLPFVQAVYGNAVSNPIQPGEVYEIFVTTSGLSAKKK